MPTPLAPSGDVFIVSAARTPVGRFGGALSSLPATLLGATAIRAAAHRAALGTDLRGETGARLSGK